MRDSMFQEYTPHKIIVDSNLKRVKQQQWKAYKIIEINLRYSCYLQQRCNFEEIAHNELNLICYAIDSCIVLCALISHRVDIYGYDMFVPAFPVPDLIFKLSRLSTIQMLY